MGGPVYLHDMSCEHHDYNDPLTFSLCHCLIGVNYWNNDKEYKSGGRSVNGNMVYYEKQIRKAKDDFTIPGSGHPWMWYWFPGCLKQEDCFHYKRTCDGKLPSNQWGSF